VNGERQTGGLIQLDAQWHVYMSLTRRWSSDAAASCHLSMCPPQTLTAVSPLLAPDDRVRALCTRRHPS